MDKSEDQMRFERYQTYFRNPFMPDNIGGQDAGQRQAKALEYIAAQLGRIANALEERNQTYGDPKRP